MRRCGEVCAGVGGGEVITYVSPIARKNHWMKRHVKHLILKLL